VDSTIWGSEALLQKSLGLWQKQFGHRGEIVLSQEPQDGEELSSTSRNNIVELDSLKLISDTKLVPRSDTPTKKGHLMLLTDASQNVWERRWFVLRRPYLHIYSHSNELDEIGVVSLDGVNVDSDPQKELLLGQRFSFTLFTSANSHALAAPNHKELQSWTLKLDPTRMTS
jgi:kinesin family protein 1